MGISDRTTSPRLSVVVVVYNMQREAPRTLFSLSAAYQRRINPQDYEVIVVENGSSAPLSLTLVKGFGDNFRYFFLEDASPSPAYAINFGASRSRGEYVGIMIDGARIVSPGILYFALTGLSGFHRAVVSSLAFHLGSDVQMKTVPQGYDADEEDRLLASIDWRRNGYKLFEISALAGSSEGGWFLPIAESNFLFMPRIMFDELGGYDEAFVLPGGGLVNLDFYYRACELPDSQLIMLLGEATFHQVHGGIMTNRPDDTEHCWAVYDEEYRRLRGAYFTKPRRAAIFLGEVPSPTLPWIKRSCELFRAAPEVAENPIE